MRLTAQFPTRWSGTTLLRTRGRRRRRWRPHGKSSLWRCSTASCTRWEAATTTTASSGRWSDPAANTWEAVAPMATPREKHAVAVLDGKLYVAGGRGAGYDRLSSVERYDPATNAWEAVAPMATARRWIHRSGRVRRQTLCRRRIGYDRPQSPQLGGAVRPGDECVGGGGADGDSAGLPRHGNARRQAVRCWRVQRRRRAPQLDGALRSRDERRRLRR